MAGWLVKIAGQTVEMAFPAARFAVSTAEDAVSTAEDAVSTAEDAVSTAEDAVSASERRFATGFASIAHPSRLRNKKRQRTGAVQDAGAMNDDPRRRGASWTAPVLWRFRPAAKLRSVTRCALDVACSALLN